MTDCLLDYNIFYSNHSKFNEFFEVIQEIILETTAAKEKLHSEGRFLSDSTPVKHWWMLAIEKFSTSTSAPFLLCLDH